MSFCLTGYELSILSSYLKTLVSHSLTSLSLSFDSVFCHFNSLSECFLKWPLFVVTWYSWFQHFYHFNSSSECFLEWLIVLIAYLSAFSNNTFVVLIFLNNSSLWYSWLTSFCFFDSLCVLMFVLDNCYNHTQLKLMRWVVCRDCIVSDIRWQSQASSQPWEALSQSWKVLSQPFEKSTSFLYREGCFPYENDHV